MSKLRCNLKIYRQLWLGCRSLVQEVDAGPPESKINDIPFELDAHRQKPPDYNSNPIVLTHSTQEMADETTSVIIKIRDGDPLCVSKQRLTENSTTFRYGTNYCNSFQYFKASSVFLR